MVWKAVPEHPLLEASSSGQVRRGTRIYRGYCNRGYVVITTPNQRTESIHRLVAAAFLGPCPRGYCVDHKDGDKLNNRPDNLEYVTFAENAARGHRMGLIPPNKVVQFGEHHRLALYTEQQVRDILLSRESSLFLAARYGTSARSIRRIRNRQT